MNFEKYEKDGQVAVIISPGFGTAWSSCNDQYRQAFLFDKNLVKAVLGGNTDKAVSIAKKKYPDCSAHKGVELEVKWLPKGTLFNVTAYDGNESIKVFQEDMYIAA